ncbi:hypothetical protein CVT25_001574 [Psilocybe cyanescens]|uniref:Uncharacterized protein n=1 Tax=Psilocybe cyanescens TaxID=93625 RepID=A0A409WQ45_PSICY|nr:hypothetical protein CVT25_001574 [Psilocybe cyanescens]
MTAELGRTDERIKGQIHQTRRITCEAAADVLEFKAEMAKLRGQFVGEVSYHGALTNILMGITAKEIVQSTRVGATFEADGDDVQDSRKRPCEEDRTVCRGNYPDGSASKSGQLRKRPQIDDCDDISSVSSAFVMHNSIR